MSRRLLRPIVTKKDNHTVTYSVYAVGQNDSRNAADVGFFFM